MADISNNCYFIGLATKDVTYTGNHIRSVLKALQQMMIYGIRYRLEFAEGGSESVWDNSCYYYNNLSYNNFL